MQGNVKLKDKDLKIIEDFSLYYFSKNKKSYKNIYLIKQCKEFFYYCQSNSISILSLDIEVICQYLNYLKTKNRSNYTLKSIRSILKELVSFLYGKSILRSNPFEEKDISLSKEGEAKVRDKKNLTDNQKVILREYAEQRDLAGYGKDTTARYIYNITNYFCWLNEKGYCYTNICAKDSFEYRNYLMTADKTLSRGTVNNRLMAIRCFYAYLLKKGIIYTNPFKKDCYIKHTQSITRNILSVKDMGILLDNFTVNNDEDLQLKSIIELLYGSALRISEAIGLKIKDIDFDGGYITIREKKKKDRERKVAASEVSLRWLKRYIKDGRDRLITEKEREDGFVYNQKRWLIIKLNKRLKVECKRHKFCSLSTHCFRHSAATHMLRAGCGIREVQAFLGHKSIETTQVYTHIVKEDLKKIINIYHPRGREDMYNANS